VTDRSRIPFVDLQGLHAGLIDELRTRLTAADVATGIHYSPALHQQPALAGRFGQATELPFAEAWAREELSLPIFPGLGQDEIERVAEVCATASGAAQYRG
jgi:dTDP-4-amino-4,6-dideoxygalactose transaminase